MTHFANEQSRDYTMNHIANEWLKTPANLRTQFPPTIDDVEGFVEDGADDIGPAVASAGYPVALLAERGYQLSVASRNSLPVPAFDYGDE